MRHTARDFAKRAEALRFELPVARRGERLSQVTQRLTQRFELWGTARDRRSPLLRERFAPSDQLRPPHQLVDGARELAREVPGDIHRRVQHCRAQQ